MSTGGGIRIAQCRNSQTLATASISPDGTFQRWRVMQQVANAKAEFQAWAPTHNVSYHKPSWFGVLEFGE